MLVPVAFQVCDRLPHPGQFLAVVFGGQLDDLGKVRITEGPSTAGSISSSMSAARKQLVGGPVWILRVSG